MGSPGVGRVEDRPIWKVTWNLRVVQVIKCGPWVDGVHGGQCNDSRTNSELSSSSKENGQGKSSLSIGIGEGLSRWRATLSS